MNKNEIDFSNQIENLLRKNGLKYKKDVIVGSTSADYFIDYSGGTAIFDLKLWQPNDLNLQLSFETSKISTSGSGVDMVYVVLPELKEEHPEKGVVSLNGVKNVIEKLREEKEKYLKDEIPKKPAPTTKPIPKDKIFAIMPFSQEFNDTFEAMRKATLTIKVECIRADKPPETGDIISQIYEKIDSSIGVIVDLSLPKPNVYYEFGYAVGKGKEVIQISSSPFENLPFDIRNNNTIPYIKGDTNKLLSDLKRLLRSLRKLGRI